MHLLHRSLHLLLLVVGAILLATPVFAQETEQLPDIDLTGINCVVNADQPANATFVTAHLKGKVFFGSADARDQFQKARKAKGSEFLPQANFQLFATKQYQQQACPLSGVDLTSDGELKKEIVASIRGLPISVCCENCQQQVNDLPSDQARIATVFTRTRFQMGFRHQPETLRVSLKEVVCLVSGRAASKQWSSDFNGAKVYFADKDSKTRFDAKPSDFAASANWQLFDSGQFVQKHCPLSGADPKPEHAVDFGKHKFVFCCQNCVDQVRETIAGKQGPDTEPAFGSEPSGLIRLLFSKQRFQLGFGKAR